MVPPKLAVVVPVTMLALLVGAVTGQQQSYAPSTSPPLTGPPSPSPIPSPISYPPSPLSSPSKSAYPPSPLVYPPSPNPLSSSQPPTYSFGPSPLGLNPPTYPPRKNPIPTTHPPSSSLTPPTYPPSANSPIYPSPSLSPTTYTPSTSPAPSPTPILSTYPPSESPSPSIPSPPTYPPSAGSSPSISSPLVSPSPSPSSSISIPPTYSPSASPNPSISNLPTNTPSASPGPSPSISSPLVSPSPSPSSPVSIPPIYPPSASPNPSISSPPTNTPSASPGPSPSSPASPTPSPSSSISTPPTYSPSLSPSPSSPPSGLSVGHYKYLCPKAESIVRDAVKSAIDSNRGTGAGLIRLFFHDCFVEGCDASVLLNTTGSSDPTERASAPNLSLRGFEVIDAAKAALESACPGVVSCADIVAFAGRDATFFLSGNAVDFDMPAGRYDGRVSLDSEARDNLPPPSSKLQQLKDMFAAKGLDTEDMVTLSGAHTVGRSHCSSFSDRLPPNSSDMNATLSDTLTSQCRNGGDTVVPQDSVTPDGLDSQYYRNVLNHEVLFASDAALLATNQTAGMVSANAFTPGLWETKFKAAMVKMGGVGIKTSANGEIRAKCWMVN